jgi:methylglutaconyl-CoA hydratase
MGSYANLNARLEEGAVTLTMNRPEKRNALNPEMMDELTDALTAADDDPACGVVILAGAGAAFCAGLDLEHLETVHTRTPAEHRADAGQVARLLRTLYDSAKPTIGAVNGAAFAGGMGLATLCDFTLCAPEAKFCYSEVRIGFVPAIVSAFLRLQVSDKRARDLLLTGRVIEAGEALDMGLVTRVVPEQDLMPEARRLAARLLRNSPAAMQATKRLLSQQRKAQLDADIQAAIETSVEARATEDFREGLRAFLEKRTPDWPSLKVEKRVSL